MYNWIVIIIMYVMTNVPTYMDIYEVNYIIVYKRVKTIALEQYYKQTAVFQVNTWDHFESSKI